MYDARNYSDGPFADFQVDGTTLHKSIMQKGLPVDVASVLSAAEWTSIEFNTSGKQMLVAAKQGLAIMLDGFNGSITQIFVASTVSYDKVGAVASHSNDGLAACFSYDDRFVLGGCEDGTIHCWNASSGNLLNKLEGHKSRVGCIAANPKFAMMASSCTNTALWVW